MSPSMALTYNRGQWSIDYGSPSLELPMELPAGVSKSRSFREHDVNRKHVYRVMLDLALTWRCVAPQLDIVPK